MGGNEELGKVVVEHDCFTYVGSDDRVVFYKPRVLVRIPGLRN